MDSDGDRVLGPDLARRVDALGLSVTRFARAAHVSLRAVNYAMGEKPRAGKEVARKVTEALLALEAGEMVEDEPDEFLTVEFRPGVWVAVRADDAATLGDLREVEEKIKRLADDGR